MFVTSRKCPYHVKFYVDLDVQAQHIIGADRSGDHRVPMSMTTKIYPFIPQQTQC